MCKLGHNFQGYGLIPSVAMVNDHFTDALSLGQTSSI